MEGIVPKDSTASDPFSDLSKLRLSQDFASTIGVKKALLTVPVRKPTRQQFIRVHPDEGYRLETAVLELKEEGETYLVDKPLWPELPGELVPKVLFTTIDRQNNVFLWPIRLPGEDGRLDSLRGQESDGPKVSGRTSSGRENVQSRARPRPSE